MPGPPASVPVTVTEFVAVGLPVTACGETPSPMKPAGAPVSQRRNGPTGPVTPVVKMPAAPAPPTVTRPTPPASVVNDSVPYGSVTVYVVFDASPVPVMRTRLNAIWSPGVIVPFAKAPATVATYTSFAVPFWKVAVAEKYGASAPLGKLPGTAAAPGFGSTLTAPQAGRPRHICSRTPAESWK